MNGVARGAACRFHEVPVTVVDAPTRRHSNSPSSKTCSAPTQSDRGSDRLSGVMEEFKHSQDDVA